MHISHSYLWFRALLCQGCEWSCWWHAAVVVTIYFCPQCCTYQLISITARHKKQQGVWGVWVLLRKCHLSLSTHFLFLCFCMNRVWGKHLLQSCLMYFSFIHLKCKCVCRDVYQFTEDALNFRTLGFWLVLKNQYRHT